MSIIRGAISSVNGSVAKLTNTLKRRPFDFFAEVQQQLILIVSIISQTTPPSNSVCAATRVFSPAAGTIIIIRFCDFQTCSHHISYSLFIHSYWWFHVLQQTRPVLQPERLTARIKRLYHSISPSIGPTVCSNSIALSVLVTSLHPPGTTCVSAKTSLAEASLNACF